MSNLIILLDQIQPLRNDRIILILVLSYLHQDFDHILDPVADASFVENSPEAFENETVGFGRVLGEVCTDFAHEPNGDFDGVVCGSFEEEEEDLESDDFMCDCLVD